MRPLLTDWKPDMHSINVVLPAPLGPISPTISPFRTSRSTSERAARPPKRTLTPAHERTGCASVRDRSLRRGVSAGSEGPDDALRDHLPMVVCLALVDRELFDAVHGVRGIGERDRRADEVAEPIVGVQRGGEAFARQVDAGVLQRLHPEVNDLVPGDAGLAVIVPVALALDPHPLIMGRLELPAWVALVEVLVVAAGRQASHPVPQSGSVVGELQGQVLVMGEVAERPLP